MFPIFNHLLFSEFLCACELVCDNVNGEVWLIEMFCFRSASKSVVGWSSACCYEMLEETWVLVDMKP